MTFKPFYVWPSVYIPFRHYFQDKSLNIFIIDNIVHNFNWLNECKDKINDSHFFFVYCGWYMDNHHAKHYHEMFEHLKLNKNNCFFLFNSIQEKNLLLHYSQYSIGTIYKLTLKNILKKPTSIK